MTVSGHGNCRRYLWDPWSIHTATNSVDFAFCFFAFLLFTFHFLHGYCWSLQHVAGVKRYVAYRFSIDRHFHSDFVSPSPSQW